MNKTSWAVGCSRISKPRPNRDRRRKAGFLRTTITCSASAQLTQINHCFGISTLPLGYAAKVTDSVSGPVYTGITSEGTVITLPFLVAAVFILALSSAYASFQYPRRRRSLELLTGLLLVVSLSMLGGNLSLFCRGAAPF